MSKFDDFHDHLVENYLTNYSKTQKKHSGTTTGQTQQGNTTNQGNATNLDPISDILLRAANSQDGLDGIDELDEYINGLGIDRTKLTPLLGELSKRLGTQNNGNAI